MSSPADGGLLALDADAPDGITPLSSTTPVQVTPIDMTNYGPSEAHFWFKDGYTPPIWAYKVTQPAGAMCRVEIPNIPLFCVDRHSYAQSGSISTPQILNLVDELKESNFEKLKGSKFEYPRPHYFAINETFSDRPWTWQDSQWPIKKRRYDQGLALFFALASTEAYNERGWFLNMALLREGFKDAQVVFNTDDSFSCTIAAKTIQGVRHVVIAFKGSSEGIDWVNNFDPRYQAMFSSPNGNYRVHNGFAWQTKQLFDSEASILLKNSDESFVTLRDLINDPDKKTRFFICGHSLGGALAQMYGARLVDAKFYPSVYTYAAPPAGDNDFAAHYVGKMDVFSFADPNDLVPAVGEVYGVLRTGLVDSIHRPLAILKNELIRDLVFIEHPYYSSIRRRPVYQKNRPIFKNYLMTPFTHLMPNYIRHAWLDASGVRDVMEPFAKMSALIDAKE